MRDIKIRLKTIAALLITIMVFQYSGAQRWGVKAGANLATISSEEQGIDYGLKLGYMLGGLVELEVGDKFFIQPELYFSHQGASYYVPTCFFCSNGPSGNLNLNYIYIPVIAKFKASDTFFIEAGPQVGILLSAKWRQDGETRDDIIDIVRNSDFGAGLGIGFEFESGLFLNARYNYGFSNIVKEDILEWNNSVVSLSMGWMLGNGLQ